MTELDPQEVLTVLDRDGFEAALKLIDCHPGSRLQRHAAAAFAEEVLPLFESEYPDDPRPRRAIEVARDDSATPEERAAAWAAAWAAGAAGAAAWVAAWARARKVQTDTLRKMLTEGF